jgi:PTS system nitrogen regulatory IIA component
MDISDFLTPDRIILDPRPRDKSQLMAEIARAFARLVPSLRRETVEAALRAREDLGSTGLGGGFALPHARIEGLPDYLGMLVRLAKPIDFRAIDDNPVRLVFTLLIPGETATPHVAALAAISRRFRDKALIVKLMQAETQALTYGLLTDP